MVRDLTIENLNGVDAVIIAVKHDAYLKMGLPEIARLCKNQKAVVIDIKGAFNPEDADNPDILYWRL